MNELSGKQITTAENQILIFNKLNTDTNFGDSNKINITEKNLEVLRENKNWKNLFVTTILYSPKRKTKQFFISRISRDMFSSLKIKKGKTNLNRRIEVPDICLEFIRDNFALYISNYVQTTKNQKTLFSFLTKFDNGVNL